VIQIDSGMASEQEAGRETQLLVCSEEMILVERERKREVSRWDQASASAIITSLPPPHVWELGV
jgi:hypothetical protein